MPKIFTHILKGVIPLLYFTKSSFAQPSNDSTSWMKKGYLRGYGVVNYYNYNWDTDPNKRNAFDAERLNLYLGYHFTDKIEFKSEIEFEHGGTGATLEFDPLEEFGEFEQEIEAGGEIILEQINLLFKINDKVNVRLGKFRFYMGLASKLDDPSEYFTTHRSEVENTILPLGWYEHGIELSGHLSKKWSYVLYVVNGLDATGFSSANWIKRGYQRRFEMANANNLAFAGRLDYHFAPNSEIGVASYAGNTTGNRPKADTNMDAYVNLYDFHFLWDKRPIQVRAYTMYGTLSNSETISKLNRNLSNNLNVKRTPVGASTLGIFTEVAYDLLSLKKTRKDKNQQFLLFGRYDYYDTMHTTQGEIFNNPRWKRSVITSGINYYPHPQIVLKAQYSHRNLGSGQTESTASTGIGFKF